MCGIGAVIKRNGTEIPLEKLRRFNDLIAHRGPDGEGIAFPDRDTEGRWNVCLVHRRLSIIDVSDLGNQPMSYDNENLWIVFNGEIYNYLELRDELMKIGYAFRSTSDTEVILAAYREWGTGCFQRMRGMWAIVILDKRNRKIVVSRDRMGIKPLYYISTEGYFAFGSEIKQLLHIDGRTPKGQVSVIRQYLLTGFEHSGLTFFENVSPVPPGTFQTLDLNTLSLTEPISFWDPRAAVAEGITIEDASRQLRGALQESVRIHLRSDVPVGCQLSGGLDSSSVFALMEQEYSGETIHSFTVSFPNFNRDETPFVNLMLDGSRAVSHFTTPASSQFLTDLPGFIWHHDEPVGSFAHYAGYILGRLIRDSGTKVVLNGQGGDELLGGYWQQYYSYLLAAVRQLNLRAFLGNVVGSLSGSGNPHLVTAAPGMVRRYLARRKSDLLTFRGPVARAEKLDYFSQYFSLDEGPRRIFELRNLILPRLLKWDDRNLMAFGVEGRYPILDHKVIELALQFNSALLYRNGWTKYPLRQAMRESIPRAIQFRRSKWGFETPQERWLAVDLREHLEKWLTTDKPLDSIVERESITRTAGRFWKSQKTEDAQLLLRLFLMDQWLRQFNVECN